MKIIPIILLSFISNFQLLAQNTHLVKGVVNDTLDNPLIMATVLLLEEIDSTMIDYGRSEVDGSFKFKNVNEGNYLVKTTYIGYLPVTVPVKVVAEDITLETIKMKPIAAELMEVVVKEARASMKMRGDTIEYDASTFQVPDGSTVEDLLRRLPGIELSQDGAITADGKDVTKVTVDGKSFFGSDPKAATKNLPAEGISKVQVFDTKTEEEETTGLSSQAEDKTMNLELKEEFKKGGFGKVVAGAGTENRAEIKGNYNKFNEKIQFSIVGVANNTGRNGLSWNDYRDFMGSQSFVFDDGGDYGFGSRGRTIYFGGGNNGIENSIQSIFFSGSGGGGFPESYNGGLNFNYDHEKNKVSAVYYYNHAGLKQTQYSFEKNFLSEYSLDKETNQNLKDVSDGHRTELNFTHEFDSLHTLKLFFNGAYIDQTDNNNGNITQSENSFLKNESFFNNEKDRRGYLGKSTILFNKKFKKKGRRFGINSTYLTTELNDEIIQQSNTNRYNKMGTIDTTITIDRINANDANKIQLKANAVYVEPLSKKFFSQTFYNFSNRKETGMRLVNDVDDDGSYKINQNLSRNFENRIVQNRIGSSIRYSHKGINVSVGLAYQAFNLSGLYNIGTINTTKNPIDETFNNFIPNLSVDISPSRNVYFSASYGRYASEPSVEDLQPVVDDSNPFYIREGNPELLPEISNEIRASFSKSWPVQAIRIRVGANYSFNQNQIISEEIVNSDGVFTVKPVNLDGGSSASTSANISFPIVKNKFTVRTNARYRNTNRPALVNGVKNLTHTNSIYGSCRLSITPNPNIGLYLNSSSNFTNTTFDIDEEQDQKIRNHNFNVEFNTKTVWGIFLNTDFEYSIYNSDFDYAAFIDEEYDINQSIPTLNVSLYKQFLKKKKLETRLSLYDAFNQNTAISQSTSNNRLRGSQTEAIGRYFMFSLTYNIQGLKDGVQKRGWW